jgi:hypothetical protein
VPGTSFGGAAGSSKTALVGPWLQRRNSKDIKDIKDLKDCKDENLRDRG